jgi:hypothetical protein
VVGALASIGRDWWWIGLIVGVLELLLGIWAEVVPLAVELRWRPDG